jgi:uncharacterized protein (TIGR03083 family)
VAEAHLDALHSSVDRLRGVAATFSDADLTGAAYPTEWSVADVLSHLGSGAVITQRRLEDALAGRMTPDDYAPGVWDAWNAKTPTAQRDDALSADAALLARLAATTREERGPFTTSMGPMTLDFTQFVAMRLNEHAFHTWDLEVVRDPAATIPPRVAGLVVDNLELVVRFTAKPTGDTTTITVVTMQPQRVFSIGLTPDTVTFQTDMAGEGADLELPAEAFARLVYGRLDAAHTPPGNHGPSLDLLRAVFPGP